MSATDEWCTPRWLTEKLPAVDLDPCSNDASTVVADLCVSLPDDGLAFPWRGVVFVNPPYSRPLPWCQAAVAAVRERDADVAMLLKLDTTTKWWAALQTSRVARFFPFRKRLAFEQPGAKPMVANFPSVLVLLHRRPSSVFTPMKDELREEGWVW